MANAQPTEAAAPPPALSVVVTIVEGGAALTRILGALRDQVDGPRLEVLVPHDSSVGSLRAERAAFPEVRFLDLGDVATERPAATAAGQHELYDRRRAAGLAASRGGLVAILEDRGAPRQDWAATVIRLHAELPAAVIGGAIEPVPSGLLNWAFWICDFSRYGLPFESGPRQWVSDVNVSYKRSAIEATRSLWRDRYQEPVVHWALQERGETLYLSNALVVLHQLAPLRLGPLLPQRFDWGRLFGAIRARHIGVANRLALVLLSPVIPFVVLVRHGRAQARRGATGRFLLAVPLLVLLLTAWTAGEVWGYITGRG